MNIVVLVSDAMRARNLGCYGYDKDTSPWMDRIAAEGVRFSHAFSAINSTDPSFTTMFTGKHPVSHGLRNHAKWVTALEKSYMTGLRFLPEILHDKGFVTIGLDWLGKWHRKGYDYYGGLKNDPATIVRPDSGAGDALQASCEPPCRKSSGRDWKKRLPKLSLMPSRGNWYYALGDGARRAVRGYFRRRQERSGKGLSGRKRRPMLSDASGLTDLAVDSIRQFAGEQSFFLFVHYWDTHIPYTAPRSLVRHFLNNYRYPGTPTADILAKVAGTKAEHLVHKATRGKTPGTIGEIMALYDASIRYVDENVGRIYACLEESGVLDDTLLVITADHGESMTEHDIYFDHHGLYDPQIRVPLIMRHGDIRGGAVHDEFVQHFDLAPTILDMAGVSDDGARFDGQSLMDLVRGGSWDRPYVFAEEMCGQQKRMIRDRRFKYIAALNDEPCVLCRRYHCRTDEFYDLVNDPGESRNIIDDPRHVEYKRQLEAYIEGLVKPQAGESVVFADEDEVNKRLEALGYI